MLIPSSVWQALSDAGLQIVPGGADTVDLLGPGPDGEVVPVEFKVFSPSRPLNPSDINELADTRSAMRLLLIVPTATAAARAAAAARGWSLIALNPNSRSGPDGDVRIAPHRTIKVGVAATSNDEPDRRPGPVAWGTITLLRRLLESPGATQKQLAEQTGVSQPRVSQALRPFVKDGLIRRVTVDGRPRWATSNWDALLNRWLTSYPGAGGISSFWYGLDTPTEQAETAIAYLATLAKTDQTRLSPMTASESAAWARGDGSAPLSAVVSGDVAADQMVPWRRPRRAVIYARRGGDLSKAGLTPSGEEEATLELVVPKDPGVWPSNLSASRRPAPRDVLPLADPLQVLWDLRRAPGPDSDQAAERLIAVLRNHASRAPHSTAPDRAQDVWTELRAAFEEEPPL